MAVSKRVRFEVLRRDGFQCQYCGLLAVETGTGLTIDHVMPVALGGGDDPANLVTACRDCNSGKSSASPDASMVPPAVDIETQNLALDARRALLRGEMERMEETTARFLEVWHGWNFAGKGSEKVPLPHDWRATVFDLYRAGAPVELFDFAVSIAMARADRKFGEFCEFRYFTGVVRNKLSDHPLDYSLTADTARTFTKHDVEDHAARAYDQGARDGYEGGLAAGSDLAERGFRWNDHLQRHIDGQRAVG